MKRKRLIVRAVSLFMVGLITTLALVIPTSAIMTEYPTEDNNTYADCVMPFNVNFVATDGSLDYVYSVPVGYNSPVIQTGTQGHETLTGRALDSGGVTPNTASLEYYYYPTEWRIGYDGTEYDDGWGGVPVTLHIDNTELDGKTIVIEAPTFYVNPLVSNWYNVSNTDTYNRWAMGAFRMPSVADSTTQAYVGRYTVYANIVDDVGTKHPVAYSKTFDTRVDNNWIPMLEASIFQDYVINSIQETGYNRIVAVTDFKAYVDYDYYEYVEPITNITFTVDGDSYTTPQGTTWETFCEGYNNDTFRDFDGEIQYEVGTDIWAPISTDGTQANIVEPTDVIQASAYLTYLGEEEDELEGTWVFNDGGVDFSSFNNSQFFVWSNTEVTVAWANLVYASDNTTIYRPIYSTASRSEYGFDGASLSGYIGLGFDVTGSQRRMTYNYNTSSAIGYLNASDLGGTYNLQILTDESVIYTDTFVTWLKANATKQVDTNEDGGSAESLDDGIVVASTDTPTTVAESGTWELIANSPLKATGIDVSYPVYERNEFVGDDASALNYGYPDFNRYISKFRGVGNLDINADFTGWIATATSGFLNFELLPNFSIGGVLAILVGFSLVILFLKIFAGG